MPSFPAAGLQAEPEFNGVKCFYPSQHILVVLVPSVMMCLTSRLHAHISICVKDHMWPCAQKVHPATVFDLAGKDALDRLHVDSMSEFHHPVATSATIYSPSLRLFQTSCLKWDTTGLGWTGRTSSATHVTCRWLGRAKIICFNSWSVTHGFLLQVGGKRGLLQ